MQTKKILDTHLGIITRIPFPVLGCRKFAVFWQERAAQGIKARASVFGSFPSGESSLDDGLPVWFAKVIDIDGYAFERTYFSPGCFGGLRGLRALRGLRLGALGSFRWSGVEDE